MIWTDIYDIAISLEDKYPEADIVTIKFTDLRHKILALENFTGRENGCNEKILEAIQQAWLQERC